MYHRPADGPLLNARRGGRSGPDHRLMGTGRRAAPFEELGPKPPHGAGWRPPSPADERRYEGIAPVPAKEIPVTTSKPAARSTRRRGRLRRRLLSAVAVVLIVAAAATARLFVRPDDGRPATVSAVVSLDRPGGTLNTALRLVFYKLFVR